MTVKTSETIRLNENPSEGYREVTHSVNEKFDHHVLRIAQTNGPSVTLFNEELDKLYEVLGDILSKKNKK